MAFITSDQLKTALAAQEGVAEADLPTKYTASILAEALQNAYQQICSALVGRGYSKSQIDTWLQGAEFNRDIGVYWCLVKGNQLEPVAEGIVSAWSRLDRRPELATVVLLDASYAYMAPASEDYPTLRNDTVTYGDMANDSTLRPDTMRDPTTGEWRKW